jgi:hypothetical protein
MWMTALLPFYESPRGTTGLALCHLGPSFKIMFDLAVKKIKLRIDSFVSGKAVVLDDEQMDRDRGKDWWVKSYNAKNKGAPPAAAVETDLTADLEF